MENSFADQFPEIAKQWHPTLNGNLKPSEVSVGSGISAYWICPKNSEHIWQTRINSRAKGRGCPFCAGKRKLGHKYRTLAEAYPEIAVEWHSTKNDISPEKIGEGSSKKVWWKCKNGHEWQTTVYARTANHVQCPYCSGNKLNKENSFGEKFPELAKQWHPTKNNPLTPYDFFPSSKEKIWWTCVDFPEHEWQTQIKTRTETSGGCPICARSKPFNKLLPLTEYNPELASEWHDTKNGDLTPDKFSAGSTKKVWWQCKNNPQHEWQATIGNRATKGRGCPYCGGSKAGTNNSLDILYPELAKEWHPTKNELPASEITPGSKRYAWWRCSINPEHEWESYVFNRVRGDGNCPICANTGKSFAEKYPEVADEWHLSKNGDVKPSDVPHSSQKKYWWQCRNNPEHEWEATPQNRGINQSGCPHCHKERQGQALSDYLASSAVSNSEFFQTFTEGIKNIQRLLKLEPSHHEQRQILNRLLYANIVTLMETFLSDAFVNIVLDNQEYTRKLVETTPKFIEGKFSKSNIFALMENLEKEVTDYLLNEVTYHNIWIVEKMYKSVLNIRFQYDLVSIDKIVRRRHDIVHRNGKTVDGKPVVISSEDVKSAIETIRDFVSDVEKELPQRIVEQSLQ